MVALGARGTHRALPQQVNKRRSCRSPWVVEGQRHQYTVEVAVQLASARGSLATVAICVCGACSAVQHRTRSLCLSSRGA